MFNVPELIGPHDALAKAQGLAQCPFASYNDWVLH